MDRFRFLPGYQNPFGTDPAGSVVSYGFWYPYRIGFVSYGGLDRFRFIWVWYQNPYRIGFVSYGFGTPTYETKPIL